MFTASTEATMKAGRLHEPGELKLDQVEKPQAEVAADVNQAAKPSKDWPRTWRP